MGQIQVQFHAPLTRPRDVAGRTRRALAAELLAELEVLDGKARLEEAHRDLMAVLGARASASDGADARATTDGLTALHRTLNRHDPLYRYDFAVGDRSRPRPKTAGTPSRA